MENIPNYVSGTFIAIVVAVLGFLSYATYAASRKDKSVTTIVLLVLLTWITMVSIQTSIGFFKDFSLPPRLLYYVGSCIISIIILFIIRKTRNFLANIPITTLHYLHIIRVPVEMVLWWLAVWAMVPFEMTFEGANLDILSGISAPFAAVFLVGKNKNRLGAIAWHMIALGLLINIVSRAISYTPYFYDEVILGVPANEGVFYFPFILLPTFVVPVVLFSHVVSLYQLIFKKDQSQF